MKTTARFFLFLAAVQLALAQPTVPISNLYPVTANTLVGGGSTTGRGTTITAGTGITIANGTISSTGGAGDAPASATYITQTPNATLTNEQPLSLLATGLLWSTTGTGVITSLTMSGDATFASNGVLTLANTAVSAGTYGSATVVPVITVDAKGRITAASNTTITATGNVTAAGTLDSGNIVIGQGAKTVATSSVFSISGSNATVTGNLSITGSTTFNNLTTSNLTVTGNIVGNLSASQVTVADAGGYYTGTDAETVLQEVGASITALNATVGPSPTGNQLISGGGVAQAPSGGLDITVSAANYSIQNTLYSSALTNLTLSAADPSNPRIDVVAVNTSGNAVIIQGTPASSPAKPDVDPSTQLELTFFLVGAGATDLDVTVVDVYLNNAEWTTTASGGTINVASTNNPYTGAVCIEGTSVTTNHYVQFVKPASGTFDMADSDNLVFYIRSKASWANNRLMTITVRNASGQLGSAVTFDQGLFGFNSGQTTTYQQIIIPTALFAANGLSTATTIRMTLGGTGGSVGFYIDDVTLQSGVASITDASRMKWRGNYVAANFYNVNDVVLSSGIQYVSLQAGVGNTPASSPTFWQPSSAAAGVGTITALTGDVSASGTGSVVATLATVNSNPGTWGSATQAPVIVLNGKGLATGASNITITPAIGSVTGLGTSVSTALGVNIGTAGSFVVNGGALGTPSSGTLTNATGLPISSGVSGLGTNVATFLGAPTFTNLSSAVTGATIFANTTRSAVLQTAEQVTLSSSSTDTYAGTAGIAATGYSTGDTYTFKANTANTGAASLNINGQGAKTIVKVVGGVTTTLADNDIRVDQMVIVTYDGTNFQLQSTLGNAAAGGSGTVTSVSVTTANGVSGSVATATTTPAITLTLGAITPSSVASAGAVSGTSASFGGFTISPESFSPLLQIGTNGSAFTGMFYAFGNNAGDYPYVSLRRGRGTNSSFSALGSGDVIGVTAFSGATSSSIIGEAGAIRMFTSEAWSTVAVGAYMAFYCTLSGNNASAERMRLSTAGNLLLGGTADTGLSGAGGLRVFSTTDATSSAGGVIVDGGLLVKLKAYITGVATIAGGILSTNSGDASSSSTGSAVFSGGLGIAKKVFAGDNITTSGDFVTDTIGKTIKIKSGSNSKAGTVTLSSGAGTISSTAITANSVLVMSLKTASGVITAKPYETAVTAGTSYTIAAGAGDNSTYNWIIFEVN